MACRLVGDKPLSEPMRTRFTGAYMWGNELREFDVGITLRTEQNDCHFEEIFTCIFLNETYDILIRISLKFVSKVPIDNMRTLVPVLAWHKIGDKRLPEPMLTKFCDDIWHHQAAGLMSEVIMLYIIVIERCSRF